MSSRVRLLLGVIVFLAGSVLAWRALHRAESPAHRVEPTPVYVEESFQQTRDGLVDISPTNVPTLLQDAQQSASAALRSDSAVSQHYDRNAMRDLAEAFRSRLAAYTLEDFDASLEDMIARGWPRPDEEKRSRMKAEWEAQRNGRRAVKIDPSVVELRTIDPGWITNPLGDPLKGFSRSVFQTTPVDNDKRPLKHLSEPDGQIIELRVRAQVPTVRGEIVDAFLGYRFTWDTGLNKWRWIQTCLYSRPGDGPFASIDPI